MKRSRAVNLVLLTSAFAALEGCSRQQCIDRNNIVVDNSYCRDPNAYPGTAGYHWYSTGYFRGSSVGSRVSPGSTQRGVFGEAGHAAAGHGGAGE